MNKDTATQAQRLWDAWQNTVVAVARNNSDANIAAEQAAHDELVDFVEAHDLNYSRFDPRGADEADETFAQDYPLTAAMTEGRTPREVAEHGKRRSADADKVAAYDELVQFVQTCAGGGYLNTRGTARQLLDRLGIPRRSR